MYVIAGLVGGSIDPKQLDGLPVKDWYESMEEAEKDARYIRKHYNPVFRMVIIKTY